MTGGVGTPWVTTPPLRSAGRFLSYHCSPSPCSRWSGTEYYGGLRGPGGVSDLWRRTVPPTSDGRCTGDGVGSDLYGQGYTGCPGRQRGVVRGTTQVRPDPQHDGLRRLDSVPGPGQSSPTRSEETRVKIPSGTWERHDLSHPCRPTERRPLCARHRPVHPPSIHPHLESRDSDGPGPHYDPSRQGRSRELRSSPAQALPRSRRFGCRSGPTLFVGSFRTRSDRTTPSMTPGADGSTVLRRSPTGPPSPSSRVPQGVDPE